MNNLPADIIVAHILPRVNPHALAVVNRNICAKTQDSRWRQCYNARRIVHSIVEADNLLHDCPNFEQLLQASCDRNYLRGIKFAVSNGIDITNKQYI